MNDPIDPLIGRVTNLRDMLTAVDNAADTLAHEMPAGSDAWMRLETARDQLSDTLLALRRCEAALVAAQVLGEQGGPKR